MKRWAGLGLSLALGVCALGLIAFLVLLLHGCSAFFQNEPQPEPDFELAVLADRRKVWVDATAFVARYGDGCKFYWDWGDGSGLVEGDPIEYHTYAREGDYVIRLKVDLGAAGSGAGVGGPGAAPGAGAGPSSRYVWKSKRANLLDLGYPVPIVSIRNHRDDYPQDDLYLAWYITFDASRSYSPDGRPLWFRWEIVYVDPLTREPAPYPYQGCIVCPTRPEFIRREGAIFRLDWLPCGPCGSSPWTYRVRCWVSDDLGRVRMWEGYIRVWC